MGVVKKKVSLTLILVAFVAMIALSGVSMFYQSQIRVLIEENTQLETSLEETELALADTKYLLDQTRDELASNVDDVNKTVDLFEETNEELTITQASLDRLHWDLAIAKASNENLLDSILEKEIQIQSKDAIINELEHEIKICNIRLNSC